VSFAEPGDLCRNSRFDAGTAAAPLDSAAGDNSGAAYMTGAADAVGMADSLHYPPRPCSSLRQALAGLQSPQRSAAFLAIESGARHVQEDALGRANVNAAMPPATAAGAAVAATRRRPGPAVPQWGMSSSIDFGQLAAADSRGEWSGPGEVLEDAIEGLGSTAASPLHGRGRPGLLFGSLPPRAPYHSLPSSPVAERAGAAALGAAGQELDAAHQVGGAGSTGLAGSSQPYVLARERRAQLGSSALVPPLRLPGGAAASASAYGLSPRSSGGPPSPHPRLPQHHHHQHASAQAGAYRLPPKQQGEQEWSSPNRGLPRAPDGAGGLYRSLSPR
jgi:hypothetical protein